MKGDCVTLNETTTPLLLSQKMLSNTDTMCVGIPDRACLGDGALRLSGAFQPDLYISVVMHLLRPIGCGIGALTQAQPINCLLVVHSLKPIGCDIGALTQAQPIEYLKRPERLGLGAAAVPDADAGKKKVVKMGECCLT